MSEEDNSKWINEAADQIVCMFDRLPYTNERDVAKVIESYWRNAQTASQQNVAADAKRG